MKPFAKLALALAASLMIPAAADAQTSARTWISDAGNDTAPCTRTLPCKTLTTALAATGTGGEIVVLDSMNLEQVEITKPVSIVATGVTARATLVTISAGASDKVELDGLDFFGGAQTGDGAVIGVRVLAAGEVIVRNCRFKGYIIPTTAFPTAGVVLSNTGFSVRLTVDNSTFSNNLNGIAVTSGPGLGHAKILNSVLTSNSNAGIQVTGTGNDVLLSNTQIVGSNKALDLAGGATAKSYGNNVLTNGDVPTRMPLN
jgi:hypothetical protein